MSFVDFEVIKAAVTLEQAAEFLKLELKPSNKQLRGPCPRCDSESDRALVITPGRGFYCFSDNKGGDVISLVAHIRDIPVKEAAQLLAEHFRVGKTEKSQPRKNEDGFKPLDYLQSEHDAVSAVGFDTDFAKEHGIGYAPKGTMKSLVLIPFRDRTGKLLGYVGVTEARLPADFTPNVVSLKRPA